MEKQAARRMLEQVARNLTAIENISRILAEIVDDRKLYSPMLRELLNSNFELQHEIGQLYPNLDPMYLGLEEFAVLRQKYEDPKYPVSIPTVNDINNAKESWSKLQKMVKK